MMPDLKNRVEIHRRRGILYDPCPLAPVVDALFHRQNILGGNRLKAFTFFQFLNMAYTLSSVLVGNKLVTGIGSDTRQAPHQASLSNCAIASSSHSRRARVVFNAPLATR